MLKLSQQTNLLYSNHTKEVELVPGFYQNKTWDFSLISHSLLTFNFSISYGDMIVWSTWFTPIDVFEWNLGLQVFYPKMQHSVTWIYIHHDLKGRADERWVYTTGDLGTGVVKVTGQWRLMERWQAVHTCTFCYNNIKESVAMIYKKSIIIINVYHNFTKTH